MGIEGALASFLNSALGFSPTLFLQLPESYILTWLQFFCYIYDKTSVYSKIYDRLLTYMLRPIINTGRRASMMHSHAERGNELCIWAVRPIFSYEKQAIHVIV